MAFGDFTVARTSVKRVLNASGVLASVAANTPALEFNADGSYRGTLVEPAGTNLCLQSQTLPTSWTLLEATISANALTSPDNTLTADKLVESVANDEHRVTQSIAKASTATQYTVSVFVKLGERNIQVSIDSGSTANNVRSIFDLSAGTAGSALASGTFTGASARIENYGNGWYRCSVTGTTGTEATVRVFLRLVSGASTTSYTGDGTSGVFLWGAQLETGSVATSYIPTVASTATRTADSVTLTGASSLIGQSEGTLFIEVETSVALSMFPIVLSDGGATNRITLRRTVSNTYELTIITGGAAQVSDTSAGAYSGIHRIAVRYTTDNVQMHINGAQVTSDTSATIPACSQVDIGQNQTGAGKLNGWIRSVVLFPTYLTTAQANDLTTL